MVADAHAAPAPSANPPWLDGRPTLELVAPGPTWRPGAAGIVKFIRFDAGLGPTYGILEDDAIHAIVGTPFLPLAPTGWVHRISAIRVLAPLGPDEFGGARWLGHGDERLSRGQSISAADLYSPETVSLTDFGRVWPVLGLVVGGPADARAFFGVTAGFLGVDRTSAPQLVLGPSIARGVEIGSLRVESGVAGMDGRLAQLDPRSLAGLSRARARLSRPAPRPWARYF